VLVLTRRAGQSLTLTVPGYPEPIRVVYVGQSQYGNALARIGIDAPRDVAVVRDDAGKKEPPPGYGRRAEGEGKEAGS
jgi:sRNA-binding carbon storage regulator CsrA